MRARLFSVLAVLLGVTIACVAIELGLRVAGPSWLRQRMEELNAGSPYEVGSDRAWPVIRADGQVRQFEPRSSFMARHYEYEHRVDIDEFGGRTTAHPAEHLGAVPFVGDSFTFGLGVRDHETFVSLLGERSGFRFVNLGVPGSALDLQLDIVAARHDELGRPRAYVFCLFLGNDLSDIRERYRRSESARADEGAPDTPSFSWRVNDFVYHNALLKRIYTIQFVRQKLLLILNRGSDARMNPVFLVMRSDTDYLEESTTYLRRELERLNELSRERRFRYLFVLIPDVHQVSRERLVLKARYYDLDLEMLEPGRVARAVSSVLDDFDVFHVDVSACLAASKSPEKLYFVQDTHFNNGGHERVAQCLAASGLIDRVTTAGEG